MDVLLVEDEPEMQALLQTVLEKRGHNVISVSDGINALKYYLHPDREFPLVILDLLLPGMDGLEVCRQIRKSPKGINSLILVNTVRTNPGDLEQVLAAGADDYIAKPIDPEILNIRLTIAEQRTASLKQRNEAIASQVTSTKRLNEAQRIAHMGSWELNLQNGRLAWSDEVFRIFEIDKADFIPTYEFFLELVHPEDRDVVHQTYSQSLQSRSTYNIIHRLLMTDGRIKWVEERCSFDFDANGKPLLSWGTVQDVTTRKQIEAELIAAKELAEHANQTKNMFMSRMSHELRTPLNAIIGFAQVMEISGDEETIGEHRYNINTITRSGWHLLKIIEDLLNLATIEANKVVLNIEPVDIRQCMRECINLISPLAKERQIDINCKEDACVNVMIHADAFRLKQVVINLLANAVKYNKENGQIFVYGQQANGFIRILISDTGIGIKEADIPTLFQPFSRLAERPYSIEGAGIGLSIAKQLTELMGGTIGVESVYGKGSTFWVDLPAAEIQQPVSVSNTISSELNEYTGTPNDEARILYIEDNPDHVDLIRKILTRMSNLSIIIGHTPALGLDLARTQKIDMIILDICLPGMNGYEVLNLLQSDIRTSHIPVIAISASANAAEIEKGLRAGFRRYLTKPLDIMSFRDAVEEVLRDAVK